MELIKKPKITIVMPNFNGGAHIEEAITSLISQNYENLELIIIDGGSTDNSIEVIRKFEKHIHFWLSEKDSGPSEAICKGFLHSSGKWLNWLNSDDYLLPGSLNNLVNIIEACPEAQWITGTRLMVNTAGSYLYQGGRWNELNFNHIIRDPQGFAQECTFFRRELYDHVSGLNPKLKSIFDRDLFLRMYEICDPVFTYAVFGAFRIRNGQLSKNEYARNADLPIIESIYSNKSIWIRILRRLYKTRLNIVIKEISNILLKYGLISRGRTMKVVLYEENSSSWVQKSYYQSHII